MDRLWKDIRYSIHSLRSNPGFALVAILTLALGIGATTAIFSIVNGVLLRPLPLRDPSRLVMVWEISPKSHSDNVTSPSNYAAWAKETALFSSIGCSFDAKLAMTGVGDPEEVRVGLANATFFPTLGATPYLGRTLTPDDERATDASHIVLTHRFWQRKFASDPRIIGKSIDLGGAPAVIVGVMQRDFFVPESPAEVWMPYALPATGGRFLRPIARLAPGVTLLQAQSRMDVVAKQLAAMNPKNRGRGVHVVSLDEQVVGKVRRMLLIVLAAVAFLLLIACVNVANLLLSRATARSKEMAIRAALGASRGRLIAQLLTESVLLASVAAVLGVVIAGWTTMLFVRFTPEAAMMPRLSEVVVDERVLLVTMAITLVTGIIFGLAPAIEGSRTDLQTTLKSAARGTSEDRRGKLFRNSLVVVEVALATVLLIGAGLMIRSFAKLQNVEPGVRADGALTMHVVLPATYDDVERRNAAVAALLDKVRNIPGVTRAGIINNMPFTNWVEKSSIAIEGDPLPEPGSSPSADFRVVTGDYFPAVGINILAGRNFDARDHANAPDTFLVNDAFVKAYLPRRNPIGRRVALNASRDVIGEIVGVVGSDRAAGLDKPAAPALYRSYLRVPSGQFSIVVATSLAPESVRGAVTEAIHSFDPRTPVSDVKSLRTLVFSSIARSRFNTTILTIFAALGLLLASIGIYGVLSYSVAQRTHEMGIRMALGADPRGVLRLVVGDGARVALFGVAIGVVLALPSMRVLASLLYGVESSDPIVMASVVATLMAVAVAASYIPARRATRVDPMVALRRE
jgi:putative ABC transport system permease protein